MVGHLYSTEQLRDSTHRIKFPKKYRFETKSTLKTLFHWTKSPNIDSSFFSEILRSNQTHVAVFDHLSLSKQITGDDRLPTPLRETMSENWEAHINYPTYNQIREVLRLPSSDTLSRDNCQLNSDLEELNEVHVVLYYFLYRMYAQIFTQMAVTTSDKRRTWSNLNTAQRTIARFPQENQSDG